MAKQFRSFGDLLERDLRARIAQLEAELSEALADRQPSHGLTPCAHLERELIRNGDARFQTSRRMNDGQETRQKRDRSER